MSESIGPAGAPATGVGHAAGLNGVPRVWVLGAHGMLGDAVMGRLAAHGVAATGSGRDVDVTSGAQVMARMRAVVPTHVINCAAYTKVDACEAELARAMAVNGEGPGHVGQAAAAVGARALHVSTDYVFDGRGRQPYAEDTPCAPLGAYGRSKHVGERAFVAALAASRQPGYILRTSWLFGRAGNNFVATMLRLMATRPSFGVVADQVGRPTSCDDLAAAILGLLGLAGLAWPQVPSGPSWPAAARLAPRCAAPGTYHFANAGEVSWHGFAEAILVQARALGWSLTCRDIRAIATTDYPTPARRPAYSVLATDKVTRALGWPPRPWSGALADYLAATRERHAGAPSA